MEAGGWLPEELVTADDETSRSSTQSDTWQIVTDDPKDFTKRNYRGFLAFKFTCLEGIPESLLSIPYADLKKKGLGIPPGEMVDGKRGSTRIPAHWTMVELRQKIKTMFPRLQTFRLYKGVLNGSLTPTTSKTVRGLRLELNRSCVYVVPDTPLLPLETMADYKSGEVEASNYKSMETMSEYKSQEVQLSNYKSTKEVMTGAIVCPLPGCSCSYAHPSSLRKHVIKVHGPNTWFEVRNQFQKEKTRVQRETKSYLYCYVAGCSSYFTNPNSIRKHVKRCHGPSAWDITKMTRVEAKVPAQTVETTLPTECEPSLTTRGSDVKDTDSVVQVSDSDSNAANSDSESSDPDVSESNSDDEISDSNAQDLDPGKTASLDAYEAFLDDTTQDELQSQKEVGIIPELDKPGYPDSDRLYHCGCCGASFSSQRSLIGHSRLHGGRGLGKTKGKTEMKHTVPSGTDSSAEESEQVQEVYESYLDDTTRDEFQSQKSVHLRPGTSAQTKASTDSARPFLCDHPGCGAAFQSIYALSGHKGRHKDQERKKRQLPSQASVMESFGAGEAEQAQPEVTLIDQTETSQPKPSAKVTSSIKCVIPHCSSREWSDRANISYHAFPDNGEIYKKWIEFVGYTQRDFEASTSSMICSKHFRADLFHTVGPRCAENRYASPRTRKLKPDAVPTILYAHKAEESGFPARSAGESSEESGSDHWGSRQRGAAGTKQSKHMLHFVKLTDINAFITCFLCGGYMFNATTITECLHSFCRKCILQHLQKDNRCPTCDMLIHESIPFHFIRPDGLLQMIINKLLPSFENIEKEAEKNLTEEPDIPRTRPSSPAPLLPTAETVPIYSKVVSSAQISLQLEYMGASSDCPPITPLEKNFVRVSSQATIRHVQKFISHKLHLGEEFEVDIICGEEILQPAVILYNLKREVDKEQIIDNILVLSYSLGLTQ